MATNFLRNVSYWERHDLKCWDEGLVYTTFSVCLMRVEFFFLIGLCDETSKVFMMGSISLQTLIWSLHLVYFGCFVSRFVRTVLIFNFDWSFMLLWFLRLLRMVAFGKKLKERQLQEWQGYVIILIYVVVLICCMENMAVFSSLFRCT